MDKKSGKHKKGKEKAKIKVTVAQKMVELAIKTDPKLGLLWTKRDKPLETPDINITKMARYISLYWKAVKETFSDLWGRPPTEQRLTHAVGLYAMTKLMQNVMAYIDWKSPDAFKKILEELNKIERIPWDHENLKFLKDFSSHKEALYNAILALYTSTEPQEKLVIHITGLLKPIEIPLKKL